MAGKAKATKARKAPKAPKVKAEKPNKKSFGRSSKDDATDTDNPEELPPFVQVPAGVDLLPREVREQVQIRKVVNQTVGLGIGAMVAFTLVFASQQGLIAKAKSDLNSEQGQASVLAEQAKKFLPVRTYFGQIESNALQIATNMSKEVAWQNTFDATYSDAAKGPVSIDSLALDVDTTVGGAQNANDPATSLTEVAAGCPQVDLFADNAPAVGCVKITGTADSRSNLSAWVTAMESNSLFVSPFVSDSTAADGEVTFTASVGVTAKVFSFRYDADYLKGDTK